MENQKFGVSQFVEQVNFQRALEGELERSIQSVDTVAGARPSGNSQTIGFCARSAQTHRFRTVESASGPHLDARQVSAIVHLVASSVPQLEIANVTIVDQNGNLLSDTSKQNDADNIDPEN